MSFAIYQEWLWRDRFLNKGTSTINAADYLSTLLQYGFITVADMQNVKKKDPVTDEMNVVSN